jgi:exopolysaccharide biosynthesis polyprenyl glycosylphosphotransferase
LNQAYLSSSADAEAAPSSERSASAAAPATTPSAPAAELRRRRLFEGSGWTLLRIGTDAALLVLGNVAAILGAPAAGAALENGGLIWLLPVMVIGFMALRGLYKDRIQMRLSDGLGAVVAATSLASISLIAASTLFNPGADQAPLIARAWLLGTAYLVAGRMLLAWAQRRARATRLVARRTLIIGAGRIGAKVERRLLDQPALGLLPVGYLDSDPPPEDMVPGRRGAVLGAPEDVGRVADATGARHVVLGFSSTPDSRLLPLVRQCEHRGIEVSLVPRFFDSVNTKIGLEHLGALPLFGLHSINPNGWRFAVKHVLDRVVAGVLLVLLAPTLAAAAIAVKLSSPGPVLFRQRRIGRDGHEFEILKFRSMELVEEEAHLAEEASGAGNVIPLYTDIAPGGIEGQDRRTRVGSFLRRTSLDELPQLLNVLKGDMSLVGPRPERPEFVEAFGTRVYRYDDRHRVKSGITGWAQVNGLRGKTSLSERVEWDNWYIANWSLSLDVRILFLTFLAVMHPAE